MASNDLSQPSAASIVTAASMEAAQLATSGARPLIRYFDDFAFSSGMPYYATANAGGTTGTALVAPTVDIPGCGSGIGVYTTGATSSSAFFATEWNYGGMPGKLSSFRGRAGFYLPVLSDGTETFSIVIGGMQSVTAAPPNRSTINIRYTSGVNGGRFQVAMGPNGGTLVDSGVTVAANTFYQFEWQVTVSAPDTVNNPCAWNIYAGASATAVASGTGTCAASSYAISCAPLGLLISKTLGTAARTLNLDYWEWIGQLATTT